MELHRHTTACTSRRTDSSNSAGLHQLVLLLLLTLVGGGNGRTEKENPSSPFVPPAPLIALKAELKQRLEVLCGQEGTKCKFACRILEAWDAPFELATRISVDEHTTADGPDFLLIGTQKGGTTDIYEQLAQQRNFQALGSVQSCSEKGNKKKCAGQKELHFFDWACLHQQERGRFKGGKRWWCNGIVYASHFKEMRKSVSSPRQFVGEATSNYLYHPEIPRMAKGLFPTTKLILLLRDPVSRAYSGFFQHFHAQGNRTFDEMISHEIRVIRRCEELLPAGLHSTVHMFSECIYPLFATEVLEKTLSPDGPKTTRQRVGHRPNSVACNPAFVRWYAHVSRGLYYFQLLQWLEHYPKEQILVLKSEDYFLNNADGIRKIVEFVGGDDLDADVTGTNGAGEDSIIDRGALVGTNSKSQGKISDKAKKRLEEVYKPYNAMLYKLLDSIGQSMAPF